MKGSVNAGMSHFLSNSIEKVKMCPGYLSALSQRDQTNSPHMGKKRAFVQTAWSLMNNQRNAAPC